MSRIKKSFDSSQIINIVDTGKPAVTDNLAFVVTGTNPVATAPALSVAPIQLITSGASASDKSIVKLAVTADTGSVPIPQAVPGALAYSFRPKVAFSLVPVATDNVVVIAGLKLTNSTTIATDDNQIMFYAARDVGLGTNYQLASGGTAGDNHIHVDTGSGTIKAGDIFSITGKTQLYTATADINTGNIAISPNLQTNVNSATHITLVGHNVETWKLAISRANVDKVYETGIPLVANKLIKFEIAIDSFGMPQAWIDGLEIKNNGVSFAKMTTANLLPMFGIKTSIAEAKTLGYVGVDIETEAF